VANHDPPDAGGLLYNKNCICDVKMHIYRYSMLMAWAALAGKGKHYYLQFKQFQFVDSMLFIGL